MSAALKTYAVTPKVLKARSVIESINHVTTVADEVIPPQ
jgi:hypothetical protein